MPKAEIPKVDFQIPHLDKVVHFTFYMMMYLILQWEIFKYSLKQAIWGAVLYTLTLASMTEVMQKLFTTTRSFELLDLFANSLGIVAGILCFKLIVTKGNRI